MSLFHLLDIADSERERHIVNWKVKENVRDMWMYGTQIYTGQNAQTTSGKFIKCETAEVNSSLGNSVVIVKVNWACTGN